MNQRQLDCFLAVASTRSFSRAATDLYLAQSTVSAQVAALEKELGITLFERERRHVKLTEAGTYLVEQWVPLRQGFVQSIAHARTIAGGGTDRLRIGYDGPLSEWWIGSATALLHEKLPETEISLHRKSLGELSAMLEEGVVDVVVSTQNEALVRSFSFAPLYQREACVYVSPDHRLASCESIVPADLAGETLISPYATARGSVAFLKSQGIDLESARDAQNGDTAFMAVQANMGVFVASHLCDEFAARYRVKALDFSIPMQPATVAIVWRRGGYLVDMLVRCAETVLRKVGVRVE